MLRKVLICFSLVFGIILISNTESNAQVFSAIKKAGKATASGIKKGSKATASGVKKGSKATAKGGRWIVVKTWNGTKWVYRKIFVRRKKPRKL